MTENPVSRRTLLTAAGSILLAGCNSNSGEQDLGTRYAQTTRSATTTATATPTTVEPADINIETRTETPPEQRRRETRTERETTTQQETATETQTQGPADSMTAARANLRDAVAEFWAAGADSETLVSVTAASVDFDEQAVLDDVSTARDNLDEAQTFRAAEQDRIENHRAFATFLEWLAETQASVIDCYQRLQEVLEHLYAEELSEAGGARARYDGAVQEARSQFEGFQERTRDGNTTAMDVVSRDAYSEKVDQWETELSGFEDLSSPLQQTRDGLDSFGEGVDSYTRSDWQSAESDLFGANNDFQIASSTLRSYDAPPAINGTVGTLRTTVQQLDEGTGPLSESAAAARSGEESDRVEELEAAIEAFEQSVKVRQLPSYEQLRSETSTG